MSFSVFVLFISGVRWVVKFRTIHRFVWKPGGLKENLNLYIAKVSKTLNKPHSPGGV